MSLRDVGASKGSPLSVGQLSRRVREAFDPAVAADFAGQDADGLDVHVSFDDAGPAAHEEAATSYAHDSGLSRTWRRWGYRRGWCATPCWLG